MTVWVVHPVKEDLSSALVFGEIRYINSRYVTADELTPDKQIPDGFWSNLHKASLEFNEDSDYMLIAGDHLQLVQFAALLAEEIGEYSVLRYDRHAQGYYPVKITS